MGCGSSASKYLAEPEPPPPPPWQKTLAKLPKEIADPAYVEANALKLLDRIEGLAAEIREELRGVQQEQHQHTFGNATQKAARTGFNTAIGALEAIGALPANAGTGRSAVTLSPARLKTPPKRVCQLMTSDDGDGLGALLAPTGWAVHPDDLAKAAKKRAELEFQEAAAALASLGGARARRRALQRRLAEHTFARAYFNDRVEQAKDGGALAKHPRSAMSLLQLFLSFFADSWQDRGSFSVGHAA